MKKNSLKDTHVRAVRYLSRPDGESMNEANMGDRSQTRTGDNHSGIGDDFDGDVDLMKFEFSFESV